MTFDIELIENFNGSCVDGEVGTRFVLILHGSVPFVPIRCDDCQGTETKFRLDERYRKSDEKVAGDVRYF